MGRVFNPPPQGPPPPTGWSPPPDWRPDPSWEPVPDDWEYWIEPNQKPFLHGFAASAAVGAVFLALVVAVLRVDPAFTAGTVFGRVLVNGAIVGGIAKVNGSRWAWWMYLIVAVAVWLVLMVIGAAGRV